MSENAAEIVPGTTSPDGHLLRVDGLTVEFELGVRHLTAVNDVSLGISTGERVGMVGESGSGKSVTALAILGLLPPNGLITRGEVFLKNRDLVGASETQWTGIRGNQIALVPQDPNTSLNPVYSVGGQITEAVQAHHQLARAEARDRAIGLLSRVGIPDAERRFGEYPHRFSGGMRQRALIAMALASEPDLLIADEPTTALDVTTQAEIIRLINELAIERSMALLLISHDLGLVASLTDRIVVMYAGRVVESARTGELYRNPRHPYTVGLTASTPRVDRPSAARLPFIPGSPPDPGALPAGCAFQPRCSLSGGRPLCLEQQPELQEHDRPSHASACHFAAELAIESAATEALGGVTPPDMPKRIPKHVVGASTGAAATLADPLLVVERVVKRFELGAGLFRRSRVLINAVDDVSFAVDTGETVGLVGESGSGKSTLGRIILGLDKPSSGKVSFNGVAVSGARSVAMRGIRRRLQIVFQDPFASLDPRMTVADIVGEPLRAYGASRSDRARRVDELLEVVGLSRQDGRRRPHAFSGGQRQRVAIARALALSPELVVCDEPVSSLDVSVQAQILNLLKDLQSRFGHSYVFISHDLGVVRNIAHRVLVMYLGQIVEAAPVENLYGSPRHPYTRALLSAVPDPAPSREKRRVPLAIRGDAPSAESRPSGCRFHTRCPFSQAERCHDEEPRLRALQSGHVVACHFAEEILDGHIRPRLETQVADA